MNEFSVCGTCGGEYDKRFVDTACPECGKQYGGNSATRLEEIDSTKFNNALEVLEIPKEYQKVKWSKVRFMKDNEEKMKDMSFMRFAEQLDKCHSIFDKGSVPSMSAIIIAPPKLSKLTWAYSCMQLALANHHSVTWLLDSQELKRLIVLGGDNPKYKLYNKITFDDYVMSDVCFVTITKTYARYEAYQMIMELLDKRARKGLATFFISRFDLKQLSRNDYDNSFESIKDYEGNNNNLKYPAIVQWANIFKVVEEKYTEKKSGSVSV